VSLAADFAAYPEHLFDVFQLAGFHARLFPEPL
jgi:hypothetical protein